MRFAVPDKIKLAPIALNPVPRAVAKVAVPAAVVAAAAPKKLVVPNNPAPGNKNDAATKPTPIKI